MSEPSCCPGKSFSGHVFRLVVLEYGHVLKLVVLEYVHVLQATQALVIFEMF